MARKEEEMRKLLQEEFRKENKSLRRLTLILAALIVVAVIAGVLLLTNIFSAIDQTRSAQNSQTTGTTGEQQIPTQNPPENQGSTETQNNNTAQDQGPTRGRVIP